MTKKLANLQKNLLDPQISKPATLLWSPVPTFC